MRSERSGSGAQFRGLLPGASLGPYQVTAKIGEGGMGVVYRAWVPNAQREVALKIGLDRAQRRRPRR